MSALWSEQAEAVAAERGVAVEILDVDNASFQLVAHARDFDVIAAPNLFGDILADTAAVLLGSRGMSYSANFGLGGRGVYQTGHGAAYDLAGSDSANPVAQILSARHDAARELRARRGRGADRSGGRARACLRHADARTSPGRGVAWSARASSPSASRGSLGAAVRASRRFVSGRCREPRSCWSISSTTSSTGPAWFPMPSR